MNWTVEKVPWQYRGLVVLNMAPVPIGALIDMIVEPRHNAINGTAAAFILRVAAVFRALKFILLILLNQKRFECRPVP